MNNERGKGQQQIGDILGGLIVKAQAKADAKTRKPRAGAKITPAGIILTEGSVAKIVKLEHAWRRLDGRNDDGFQVAPFPG
ncbi:hypothetical protein ACK4QX_20760 [Proteus mirabilis]|uniref:hypothetical protein n=1 Tax=Proteus mirabilis TaxID=584 RepID=UPI00391C9080